MKRRRPPRRRNPIAAALRALRPKVVPSGKAYRRRSRHRKRDKNLDIT